MFGAVPLPAKMLAVGKDLTSIVVHLTCMGTGSYFNKRSSMDSFWGWFGNSQKKFTISVTRASDGPESFGLPSSNSPVRKHETSLCEHTERNSSYIRNKPATHPTHHCHCHHRNATLQAQQDKFIRVQTKPCGINVKICVKTHPERQPRGKQTSCREMSVLPLQSRRSICAATPTHEHVQATDSAVPSLSEESGS